MATRKHSTLTFDNYTILVDGHTTQSPSVFNSCPLVAIYTGYAPVERTGINQMSNTMKTALEGAITEALVEQTSDVLSKLSVEQQAALESKFMALPIELRSNLTSKYPGMTFAAMYITRQAIKEANSRLVSQNKGKWYSTLDWNAASLKSSNQEIGGYAEKTLRDLAEEFDGKVASDLLKKYKNAHDTTPKDAHIMQLAGIFGVNPATLA